MYKGNAEAAVEVKDHKTRHEDQADDGEGPRDLVPEIDGLLFAFERSVEPGRGDKEDYAKKHEVGSVHDQYDGLGVPKNNVGEPEEAASDSAADKEDPFAPVYFFKGQGEGRYRVDAEADAGNREHVQNSRQSPRIGTHDRVHG